MYWLLPSEKQDSIRLKVESLTQKLFTTDSDTSAIYKRAYIFSGRKSDEITKILINELSNKKDMVYDPFMGSGTTVYQAALNERSVIGNDIDNYSYYIVKNMMQNIDEKKLKELFDEVKSKTQDKILDLYQTKCCGEINYIDKLFFDRKPFKLINPLQNTGFKAGNNIKLIKECKKCNRKDKKFDAIDQKELKKIELINTDKFPNPKFIINSRINITAKHSEFYGDHFTKRAKVALLLLQKSIDNLTDSKEKDIIQLSLVTSLHLMKITDYKSKSQDLYHLVDKFALEHNVWNVFQERYEAISEFKMKALKAANNDTKTEILNKSAFLVDKIEIKDNSIDLIITDPPYTDLVPYLERNQLFRIWLEYFVSKKDFKFTDYMKDNEMIISNSPERANKHSWDQYAADIDFVFKNCTRVLKEDCYCVFFIRPGRHYWMEVVNHFKLSARKYGLEPIHRVDVSKADPTMRKLASSNWANDTDSIMIFYKPKSEYQYWFIGDEWIEKDIVRIISKEISNNKDNKILFSIGMDKIKALFKDKDLSQYLNQTEKIEKVLNRYFTIDRGVISLTNNSFIFDDFRAETINNRIIDLVPELIETLLDEKASFTYEELMLKISFYLDNGDKDAIQAFSENRNKIKEILKQLTDETKDGFVRKKLKFKIKEGRQNLHSLTGTEFEDLLVGVFKERGYYEVLKIGGAGDRGVDIVCKTKKGNIEKRVAIQCKRWKANVGSTAIQRLHSYGIVQKQDILICCTTSDFTKEGKYMADNTGVVMVDGNQILEWVEKVHPGKFYL
jgi:DNA modification methylase